MPITYERLTDDRDTALPPDLWFPEERSPGPDVAPAQSITSGAIGKGQTSGVRTRRCHYGMACDGCFLGGVEA